MDRRSFLSGIAALPLVVDLGAFKQTAIIGKWTGTLRYGNDTAPFALEFKIGGKKHALIAYLWSPAIGIYGLPASYVKVAPGRVELINAKLDLKYDGEMIRGTLSPLGDAIELHRTNEELPKQPPAPPMVFGARPRLQWQTKVGPVWDAPLTSGSAIYAADINGTLHALDGAGGAAVWSYEAGSRLFGSAAADGDALVLLDERDVLHRVETTTGRAIWRRSLGAGKPLDTPGPKSQHYEYRTPTPLVDNGVAYLGTGSGTFYALDARTGDVRWVYKTPSAIRSTAGLAKGLVVFGTWSGDVVALDAATGKHVWSFSTAQPIAMRPVFYGDLTIIGSRNALLYGLSTETGQVRWSRYLFQSFVESAPLAADGVAYVGTSDLHAVRAFDPASGKVYWTTTVYGWTWGTPLLYDGVLYVATASLAPYITGMLSGRCALRASDGVTLWRDAAGPTNGIVTGFACDPVLAANGNLIYAGIDGTIAAYK